jgi:hypothetical protein
VVADDPWLRAVVEFVLIEGVGTLRLTGWASRAATAEAGARTWQIKYLGFTSRVIHAADSAGAIVGLFESERRTPRRGGALRWSDREFDLRHDSTRREHYTLLEGDRRFATLKAKNCGKRPLNITVHDDLAAIDLGLLLLTAFVVLALAENTLAGLVPLRARQSPPPSEQRS